MEAVNCLSILLISDILRFKPIYSRNLVKLSWIPMNLHEIKKNLRKILRDLARNWLICESSDKIIHSKYETLSKIDC